MTDQAVEYQTDLLSDLVTAAKNDGKLAPEEADTLCERIDRASSEQEIEQLWLVLEREYGLLSESP